MATWEIRLINQEPVRVDVDDARNLTEEYGFLEEAHGDARWWKFWAVRPSPYWQVTDTVVLHKDAIVGVLPRKPKMLKPRIGFY